MSDVGSERCWRDCEGRELRCPWALVHTIAHQSHRVGRLLIPIDSLSVGLPSLNPQPLLTLILTYHMMCVDGSKRWRDGEGNGHRCAQALVHTIVRQSHGLAASSQMDSARLALPAHPQHTSQSCDTRIRRRWAKQADGSCRLKMCMGGSGEGI